MGNSKYMNKGKELRSIDGKRFRNMWSGKILFFFLYIEYCAFVLMETACLIDKHEVIDFSGVNSVIIYNIVIIFLLIICIFINNKFLGGIVAVINDKGIYTNAGFILWKDIKAVKYNTSLPGKHMTRSDMYCSISLYTAKREYNIIHAPRMMMCYIKKMKPEIKIKFDYGLLLFLICPFIFGVVIGLLNR